jgi:sirohydrochlorin ferrochelatase
VKILLVDNGSLEPAATLALRDTARRLARRTGREIIPVSLLHADKVPAADLGGIAAATVETFLRGQIATGETDFVVLPLFFGPSHALTEYLPALVANLRAETGGLRVRVAPALYRAGDDRLARMLAERVRERLEPEFTRGEPVRVALVDHGSPVRAVTAVRDALAEELARELGGAVAAVAPCSMERRTGAEYDFNEPLLAVRLSRAPWNTGPVIVAQLFLAPGRHAGTEGDIAAICQRAEGANEALRVVRTEVLGAHPLLIGVLADRLAGVTAQD